MSKFDAENHHAECIVAMADKLDIEGIRERHETVVVNNHALDIDNTMKAFTGKMSEFNFHKISFLYYSLTTLIRLFLIAHDDRKALLDEVVRLRGEIEMIYEDMAGADI